MPASTGASSSVTGPGSGATASAADPSTAGAARPAAPDDDTGRREVLPAVRRAVSESEPGSAGSVGSESSAEPVVGAPGAARPASAGSGSGMRGVMDGLQALGGHVGVELGGRERRMAQQFLHASQVGSSFEQVGGR